MSSNYASSPGSDNSTTITFAASGQCCTNSLYASAATSGNGTQTNVTVSSQGYGALSYSNLGWTAEDTDTPIYACQAASPAAAAAGPNASDLLLALSKIPVAADAYLSRSTSGYSKPRVTVDGRGFGNETYGLAVTVGGASCDNVDLCHTMCTRCSGNSDCSSGRVCVRWTTSAGGLSASLGYCLRYCNSDSTCPCGGQCYILSSTDPLSGAASARVCANRGLTAQSASSAVCATGEWRPAANTTLDSRLECSLNLFPPASKVMLGNQGRMLHEAPSSSHDLPEETSGNSPSLGRSAIGSRLDTGLSQFVASALSHGPGKRQTLDSAREEPSSALRPASKEDEAAGSSPSDHLVTRGQWAFTPVSPAVQGGRQLTAARMAAVAPVLTSRFISPNLASYGPFSYRYGGVCSGALPLSTVSPPSSGNTTSNNSSSEASAASSTGTSFPSGLAPVIVIANGYASTGIDAALLTSKGLQQYASGPFPSLPAWYVASTASNLNFSLALLYSGMGPAAAGALNGTDTGEYPTLPYSYPIPLLNLTQTPKGLLFGGECVTDADCPILDSCTVARCARQQSNSSTGVRITIGCCEYSVDPAGSCSSADATLQSPYNFVAGSAYLPLPREVAGALPLPPPPAGLLNSSTTDMSLKSRALNPGFILWDPRSLWYNAYAGTTTTASGSTVPALSKSYALSDASYEDDEPTEQVSLPFDFPFFGASLKKIWISPNGFMRSLPLAPCGATYVGVGCSLLSSYVGTIGALTADFSPKDYRFSEIYRGAWNLSSLSPSASAGGGSLNPSSSAVFCTSFMNMGLWRRSIDKQGPPNPGFAFHACIYADGGVRLRYGAVMNVPAPDPTSWGPDTTVAGWGGTPNSTDWLAGVRSPSAGAGLSGMTTDDALQSIGGQNVYTYPPSWASSSATALSPSAMGVAVQQYNAVPDVAVETPTNILLSRKGVRQGATAAMCALTPVACSLGSSCGTAAGGTTLSLQWTIPGCGSGFDPLFLTGNNAAVTSSTVPRLECVFGGVAVPAQPVLFPTTGPSTSNPNNVQYSVNCVSPPASAIANGSSAAVASNLTVPVTLRLIARANPAAYVANSNPASIVSSQAVSGAGTPGAYGVLGTGPAAAAISSVSGTVAIPLPVYTLQARFRVTNNASFRQEFLVPSPLLFTYLAPGASGSPQCGCSPESVLGSPSGTCDACGVCGGDGKTVDCAGVCFGTAYFDDCGVCTGGTTGRAPNADKDCNGICFGPATDCGGGGDGGMSAAATALAIVLIISLITCSIVVFSILAYCAWAGVQHRRQQLEALLFFENGGAEAEIPGPPAGLSETTMATMPVFIYGQEPPAPVTAEKDKAAPAAASTPRPGVAVSNPMSSPGTSGASTPSSKDKEKGLGATVSAPASSLPPADAAPVPANGAAAATGTPAAAPSTPGTTTTNNNASTDDSCAICLEQFVVGVDEVRKMSSCKHLFHKTCSDEWLSRSTACPVCRADLRGPTELAEHEAYQRQVEELRTARRAAAATSAITGNMGAAAAANGATGAGANNVIVIAVSTQGGRRRRRNNEEGGGNSPRAGQLASGSRQSREAADDDEEEDDGDEDADEEELEDEQEQVRNHESRSTAVSASASAAARRLRPAQGGPTPQQVRVGGARDSYDLGMGSGGSSSVPTIGRFARASSGASAVLSSSPAFTTPGSGGNGSARDGSIELELPTAMGGSHSARSSARRGNPGQR